LDTKGTEMFEPDEIVERYVELWNQPDAERRRAIIRELWTHDCAHILQAPQDIRDRAATGHQSQRCI
jgi:hypothetical protein